MLDDAVVLGLLWEIEDGCREHSCTPHNMSLEVEGDTLLELCRTWLAAQDAQIGFDKYQQFVNDMKIYPEQYKIVYPALGLAGEAGEIAEKVKKVLRDSDGEWADDKRAAVLDELGDPLFYIAALADDLGFSLREVMENNVSKLTSRKSRGVLRGSGDDR